MSRKLASKLAIEGGQPIRTELLPYGQQWISDDDIESVVAVLRSDWLTTGPNIAEFERAFGELTAAREAVAVSNGTAALHAAMFALNIKPGDEVIVPALTFAASANCVVYQGGTPVFADVDSDTLLLDPASVVQKITPRTRAMVTVDYAGQPCEYDVLRGVAEDHGVKIVADACHAVGGRYNGRPVGSLGDLNTFSFHPVKHFTTGEGGMITTDDPALAGRMRVFRNHGITSDHRQRAEQGGFFYEMVTLGYNYRLTDFQCVLGLSQLRRLNEFVQRRQEIAAQYDAAFAQMSEIQPLTVRENVSHAYHLYVVRFGLEQLRADRQMIFAALRAEGIGVNVHYIPVHLHPFYRERFNTGPGLCPVTEAAYERLITLPLFPQMTSHDVDDVITAVAKVIDNFRE